LSLPSPVFKMAYKNPHPFKVAGLGNGAGIVADRQLRWMRLIPLIFFLTPRTA